MNNSDNFKENGVKTGRLPHWMKMERASGHEYSRIKNLVKGHDLHTICTSGNCPNIGECWNRGTATFMILGNICTRHCKFCAVPTGRPLPPDPLEPERLSKAIGIMGIKHCVITSVDRDDLGDFGSSEWAAAIKRIKQDHPSVSVEVLIPDFQGNMEALQRVIDENPEVISHNMETVKRLTPLIRSRAKYETSLEVLKYISKSGITAKSGIMLGLGEMYSEVMETMDDLLAAGVKVITIGQYLRPTKNHMPVAEYINPSAFDEFKTLALSKGFVAVESSPLVRSSYHAEKHIFNER